MDRVRLAAALGSKLDPELAKSLVDHFHKNWVSLSLT